MAPPQALRATGAAGGVGAGYLAFRQATRSSDAANPNPSTADQLINGTGLAANTTHAAHGLTQGRDLAANRPVFNAPPPPPGTAGPALTGRQVIGATLRVGAPALGGAYQIGDGVRRQDPLDVASGSAKVAGAGLLPTPLAPYGAALIAGSTAFDVGRGAYNQVDDLVRNGTGALPTESAGPLPLVNGSPIFF